MVRLLASLALSLLANAVGLLAASLLLDGFSIDAVSFVIAVAIYSFVNVIIEPLITKVALTKVPALRGGVALVTTFVALLVTNLVSDGIQIEGINAWVLATLVVWLFSLIAVLVLPLFILKQAVKEGTDEN